LATSLSVLLPVHNAQAKLVPLVSQLLEVLPDLTPRWDILVIDNASTDATSDVAHDLARHYPQVHLLSHPRRLGNEDVLRAALTHATGDMVLVRTEDSGLDLRNIDKLWRQMDAHDVIVGRAASAAPLGWLPRLPLGKSAAGEAEPGLQLIRRRVLEGWRTANDPDQSLGEYLVEKRFSRCEVEMREQVAPPAWEAESQMRDRDTHEPTRRAARTTRSEQIGADRDAPKRPNYLSRIKAFALGE